MHSGSPYMEVAILDRHVFTVAWNGQTALQSSSRWWPVCPMVFTIASLCVSKGGWAMDWAIVPLDNGNIYTKLWWWLLNLGTSCGWGMDMLEHQRNWELENLLSWDGEWPCGGYHSTIVSHIIFDVLFKLVFSYSANNEQNGYLVPGWKIIFV